jgi:hypothetical protein
MADDPRCPECQTPVQSNWDWCHACGFDPDGLKPTDWMVERSDATATSLPPPPAGGVGVVARPKGRRRFRAPKTPPPPTPVDDIITLPPDPGPAIFSPAHRSAASEPPPGAPTAPAPAAPDRLAPARPDPAPSPAPTRTAAPVGLTTVRLRAGTRDLTLALGLAVLAALMLAVAVAGTTDLGKGGLDTLSTAVLVLLCLGLAAGLATQAFAMLNVRVSISGDDVVAHNRFGPPRRAAIAEIFSVQLTRRDPPLASFLGDTVDAPYVQLSDGRGFFVDALERIPGEEVPADRRAALERLNGLVARHRVAPDPGGPIS